MSDIYDIIIIGAGPAGLTAAIYARRAMKKTLVIEALNYGGQIINTLNIENYPALYHISGYELATNMYNQAIDLGTVFIFEKVLKISNYDTYKEVTTNKKTYQAKTIIIATGTSNKKLGLKNEDELIGKGISYCATCDGNFYKEQEVAVIGGGNTAIEDALYLSDIAKKVYIIHRSEKFRGDNIEINRLKNKKNVEILYNYNVTKLLSDDKLKGIEITNNKGEKQELKIAGLFVAIGRKPNNEICIDLIDNDDSGYIKASENCHTNIEGIYAAGDNRIKELRQLVTATNDGAISAYEAIKYLQKFN